MFAYLHRQGTHQSAPVSKAGTRLRRVAAALAAVTVGLLASAAAIPAAFARDIPYPLPGGQHRPAYPRRSRPAPSTRSPPAWPAGRSP